MYYSLKLNGKELQEKCKGITGPKRLGDIWVTGGEIVIITNFSQL